MSKNPKFLEEVAAEFGKDHEIIVVSYYCSFLLLSNYCDFFTAIQCQRLFVNSLFCDNMTNQGCQSGKRSMMAAADLLSAVSVSSSLSLNISL